MLSRVNNKVAAAIGAIPMLLYIVGYTIASPEAFLRAWPAHIANLLIGLFPSIAVLAGKRWSYGCGIAFAVFLLLGGVVGGIMLKRWSFGPGTAIMLATFGWLIVYSIYQLRRKPDV